MAATPTCSYRGTGTRLVPAYLGTTICTVMRPRQSCRLLGLLIAMLCSGIVYPVATGAVDLEAVTERAVWHAMPVVRVWFSWNEFSVGLGNSLAGYWYGRAVCQLLGLPFDIGAAPIEQTGFLAALPLEVAAPAGGPLVTTPEQLADFKEMLDCVAGTQHGIYAHECAGTVAHPAVMEVLRRESLAAMDAYNLKFDIARIHFEPNDVVIHLRCGDVMTGGGGDTMGFYSFDYYTDLLPEDTGVVYVVSDINIAAGGYTENVEKPCTKYAAHLVAYVQSRTGKTVEFVGSSIMNDYAALVDAPMLVGTRSTFSLFAAFMNRHGNAHMPLTELYLQGKPVPVAGIYWVEPSPGTAFVSSVQADAMPIEELLRRLDQTWEGPALQVATAGGPAVSWQAATAAGEPNAVSADFTPALNAVGCCRFRRLAYVPLRT